MQLLRIEVYHESQKIGLKLNICSVTIWHKDKAAQVGTAQNYWKNADKNTLPWLGIYICQSLTKKQNKNQTGLSYTEDERHKGQVPFKYTDASLLQSMGLYQSK